MRLSKTVNGEKTTHIWDGSNIVMELNASNAVIDIYIRGINLIKNNSGYYLFNAHGDVVSLANASGTVTKNYHYDSFGNETNKDANDKNPFRYCGEYFDLSSGTYYLRNRYYNPSNGRFLTEDPIRDGLNWYTYCLNSPIIYVDPSGHEAALQYMLEYAAKTAGPTLTVIEGGLAATTAVAGTSSIPIAAGGVIVAGSLAIIGGMVVYTSVEMLKALSIAMELKSLELPPATILVETRDTVTYKDINGAQHTVSKSEFLGLHGGFYNMTQHIKIDEKQFGKKIGKHAEDYGLDPGNASHRNQLRGVIDDIFYNPNQIRIGSFKGQGENNTRGLVKFYVRGYDVVITDMNGNFISLMKDGINNPSVNNASVIYDSNSRR